MPNTFARVRAVAFDLDGTLCDSIPDLAGAANAMRVELGLAPLPQEQIQSYVGDGIAALVLRALSGQYSGGDVAESLRSEGFAVFARHYARHLADATRPYPHTETALELLKSLGLPLAVVTNKSEVLSVKLLRELQLDGYFSLVVGGDTLPERKPSAEPLRYSAEVLGVECAQLLMVGDSANDILSAKAAGCPVIGVRYGYGDMDALAAAAETRPDALIDSLPELYELLKPVQAA